MYDCQKCEREQLGRIMSSQNQMIKITASYEIFTQLNYSITSVIQGKIYIFLNVQSDKINNSIFDIVDRDSHINLFADKIILIHHL